MKKFTIGKSEIDLSIAIDKNYYLLLLESYRFHKVSFMKEFFDGYCPESRRLNGKSVKMRLNKSDFFESEETGLQIYLIPGVLAVKLNIRGSGEFKQTVVYASDFVCGEALVDQQKEKIPFY